MVLEEDFFTTKEPLFLLIERIDDQMRIRLLRHATILISVGNKNIIVDPMFMSAGSRTPIPTRKNGKGKSNPLVGLPMDGEELKEIVNNLDVVLLTHMHFDHFHDTEGAILRKNIPILCQPSDINKLKQLGYKNVTPIDKHITWEGLNVTRINCYHGGVILRQLLGKGSGYIISVDGEPSIYVSGDTVWCSHVKKALSNHKPDISILNAGGAQFPIGRSITMNKKDIAKVCKFAPNTKVVVVHLEAFNHCLLTRVELSDYLRQQSLLSRVKILNDGESVCM